MIHVTTTVHLPPEARGGVVAFGAAGGRLGSPIGSRKKTERCLMAKRRELTGEKIAQEDVSHVSQVSQVRQRRRSAQTWGMPDVAPRSVVDRYSFRTDYLRCVRGDLEYRGNEALLQVRGHFRRRRTVAWNVALLQSGRQPCLGQAVRHHEGDSQDNVHRLAIGH